jgi:hypothetical protein
VKQKENIFEELNKMRSLIHTKPGVVISEQIILSERNTVAGTDDDLDSISQLLNSPIDTTGKQINSVAPSFSNSKSVIFKSPDNSTYVFFRFKPGGYWSPQNFVLKINGQQKTFGTFDLQNIYFKDPKTAESQWGKDSGFNTIVPIESIKGSGAPTAVDTSKVEEMWKNPNVSCVTTQPDAKKVTLNNGSIGYRIGTALYYSNGRKQMSSNQPMTNYSCSTEFKSGTSNNSSGGNRGSSNVISDYAKEVQTSLGVTPTGKISDADLDEILKKLGGTEVSGEVSQQTQSIPMDANGQPDLDKILASL